MRKIGGQHHEKHSTVFIGLDTHKDSISVAYATDSRTEPVTYLGAIGTQHYAIRKMVRQFESRHPGCQLQFVYEAGPCGYWLYRLLLQPSPKIGACVIRVLRPTMRQTENGMKKSRYSESQIVKILKEVEGGRLVKEVCREYGISDATYYNWKSKYGGMEASNVKRLKELEEENRRLKQMYAELSLDHKLLKDVIEKNVWSAPFLQGTTDDQ